MNKEVSLGDPLSKAFNAFKENLALYIVATLIFLIVFFTVFILSYTIILLPLIFLWGPMYYGLFYISTNVLRGEKAEFMDVFKGMKDGMLGKNLFATFLLGMFIVLWSLLFIIPGIIAMLRYSFTFLILRDNPDMSANEARKRSCELTKGHKGKILVYTIISGLGSYIFGIGMLITYPIGVTAITDLYERVK